MIAVDASDRNRPVALATLVNNIHACGCLAMADCATFSEGMVAVELGCQIIGATLSGYTGGPVPEQPDYILIEQLASRGLRVMAEGRIKTPQQAAMALTHAAILLPPMSMAAIYAGRCSAVVFSIMLLFGAVNLAVFDHNMTQSSFAVVQL